MRVCCGERHNGVVCSDGKVMCCLCFDRVEKDELFEDESGDRYDICKPCGELNEALSGSV